MMRRQLLGVGALCLALFAAAFRLGWWASDSCPPMPKRSTPALKGCTHDEMATQTS
ncbi:Uncharacterised protein [Mycobacteroides abscessus subsp. massiliense]|nr:Uncharacterised protein [Mycobacteroides abscessus subsp. massiliense]SLI99235.1 Uncharacterised protein [Mycobacteroides abscessus subsp. massiliense]